MLPLWSHSLKFAGKEVHVGSNPDLTPICPIWSHLNQLGRLSSTLRWIVLSIEPRSELNGVIHPKRHTAKPWDTSMDLVYDVEWSHQTARMDVAWHRLVSKWQTEFNRKMCYAIISLHHNNFCRLENANKPRMFMHNLTS